ncbi:tRNA-dihydrouridine synthase family protein [Candidatus Woesearchaeota archaeon]|nr:tRNA-dihydrouridine synthase family protein [Candidatus Woesearchaeota archaeon]
MEEFPKIGDFQPKGKFFLAPMEAVNCASFRILCKRRGAALVYTDMIDADDFAEEAKKTSVEKAVKKFVNPQKEEQPLAIQLIGAKADSLLFTANALEKNAVLVDFNIGCSIGTVLGKKCGCYLMKHPDQLYKLLKALRENIKKPLTLKMRSGWDKDSINAVEISKEAEKIGINAVAIHARTKEQGYRDKSDWELVKEIKKAVSIPVILSGDVFNDFGADKAFAVTKCDYIMIGRGARANPSIFTQLNKWYETKQVTSTRDLIYNKWNVNPAKDFIEFLDLYHKVEDRRSFSEIKDHALWTAIECKYNRDATEAIMNAEDEKDLIRIVNLLEF